MTRLTLLLNHVLGQEHVAKQHLIPHVGKCLRIEVQGWPGLLPPLPCLQWQVTPAGLLEWMGPDAVGGCDLTLGLKMADPLRMVDGLSRGEAPAVDIAGDAQFAGDVNWLMQNLRWDIAADLERVFPQPLALGLQKAGSALAAGLRVAVQGLAALRQRAAGPAA